MKLYTYLATEVVATRSFALSAMIARWNVAKIWFWLRDGVGKQFVHCLDEAYSTYRNSCSKLLSLHFAGLVRHNLQHTHSEVAYIE